ncbi:oligosaccharide flippase family protein [Shewanella sp. 0m-11]
MLKIKNVGSQFAFQIGSFILPLMLIPYLINVLSAEKYQTLVILQSAILFLAILINYGFDLKGVKTISQFSDCEVTCSTYLKNAFISKILIFLLVTPLSVIFAVFIFEIPISYILSSVLWLFAYLFQFNWYFQGKGDFSTVVKYGLLPKIFILPLVFFIVSSDSDAFYYILVNAVAVLVSNLLIFFKMFIVVPSFRNMKASIVGVKLVLFDGFSVFLSQVSTALINNANVFILPLLLEPKSFIVFNTAERLMRVISLLMAPFTSVLYPHISKIIQDKKQVFILVSRIIVFFSAFYGLSYFLFYLFGGLVIELVFPKIASELINYLMYMLAIPFMVFLNNLFGTQIGLNMNQDRLFAKVVFFGGIVNVLLISVLTIIFKEQGAILAVILSQIVILIGMYKIASGVGYEFKL